MTVPGPRSHPIVLRSERFGGILFDTADGTHVELDAEAFALARDWLLGRRAPESAGEHALLEELKREVPSLGEPSAAVRLVPDHSHRLADYRNATVLGSPTLVDLQLTQSCRMGCPHCYASSQPDGEHMALDDALMALETIAEAGVCQLAIGGGEPLRHPHLARLIRRSADLGMVPNLTTTGDGLSRDVLRAMHDCCGAVALSLEDVHDAFAARRRVGFDSFRAAHAELRAAGIPVAFHVTLSAENLPRLGVIIDYCLECPELYGVVFLAYKPVGRGRRYDTPLSAVPPRMLHEQLRGAFSRLSGHTRVGYDCCLTPAIVELAIELGHGASDLLEGCSAARGSVGVTTSLDVVPCTFLPHRPLGRLGRQSLLAIWHGAAAHEFRRELDEAVDRREPCRGCPSRQSCLGGCPEWSLVRCVRGG